jgi:hypothetical protein
MTSCSLHTCVFVRMCYLYITTSLPMGTYHVSTNEFNSCKRLPLHHLRTPNTPYKAPIPPINQPKGECNTTYTLLIDTHRVTKKLLIACPYTLCLYTPVVHTPSMRQTKTPDFFDQLLISDQRLSGKPTRALFSKAMLLRDPLAVRNSCEYGSKVLTRP